MKICKSILFICLVSSYSATLNAQPFKVLVSKGNNQISGAGSTLSAIKTGQKILSTDEVIIGESSYLGILTIDGRPIEIRRPGRYKSKDLIALRDSSQSVISKYVNFITSSSNEGSNNKLAATGAVHRGTNDIQLFIPSDGEPLVANDKFACIWVANDKAIKTFTITITSLLDDQLIKQEVNGNQFEINLQRSELIAQTEFVVQVSSATDSEVKSKQYFVRRISAKAKEEVQTQLKGLELDLSDPIFGNLALAGYYSQNKMLIDAITCLDNAVKLSASDDQITKLYTNFLSHHFPK